MERRALRKVDPRVLGEKARDFVQILFATVQSPAS